MSDASLAISPRYLRTAEAARYLSLSPSTSRNIEPTALVPLTGKSAAASCTRLPISTHGQTSAPEPRRAIQAPAPYSRQSGTLPSPMRERSGADP